MTSQELSRGGATGGYIPFQLVCRWLTMPSRTPFGAYYIYQCVSITLFVHWSGCGRPQIAGRAEARYPAFSFVVNQTIKNLSDSGCLADKIERNVK